MTPQVNTFANILMLFFLGLFKNTGKNTTVFQSPDGGFDFPVIGNGTVKEDGHCGLFGNFSMPYLQEIGTYNASRGWEDTLEAMDWSVIQVEEEYNSTFFIESFRFEKNNYYNGGLWEFLYSITINVCVMIGYKLLSAALQCLACYWKKRRRKIKKKYKKFFHKVLGNIKNALEAVVRIRVMWRRRIVKNKRRNKLPRMRKNEAPSIAVDEEHKPHKGQCGNRGHAEGRAKEQKSVRGKGKSAQKGKGQSSNGRKGDEEQNGRKEGQKVKNKEGRKEMNRVEERKQWNEGQGNQKTTNRKKGQSSHERNGKGGWNGHCETEENRQQGSRDGEMKGKQRKTNVSQRGQRSGGLKSVDENVEKLNMREHI